MTPDFNKRLSLPTNHNPKVPLTLDGVIGDTEAPMNLEDLECNIYEEGGGVLIEDWKNNQEIRCYWEDQF